MRSGKIADVCNERTRISVNNFQSAIDFLLSLLLLGPDDFNPRQAQTYQVNRFFISLS